MRIGITDCSKFENYRRWIAMEPGVEVVKLGLQENNAVEGQSCDAIIFSGGEDVHPALYGKPEFVEEYGLKEIIPERDQFEYEVFKNALEAKKPILGICRGMQVINVYLGGTLLPDIPCLSKSTIHGKISGQDQIHDIRVERSSRLFDITGKETGQVNSAHHQGVDRPAVELKTTALAEPSIIEAMEWQDPADKSWLLLVQWHPERMSDLSSPFSKNIKRAFLNSIKSA